MAAVAVWRKGLAVLPLARACLAKAGWRAAELGPRWYGARVYAAQAAGWGAAVEPISKQQLRAGPLERYDLLVREGTLRMDPAQRRVATVLDSLWAQLADYQTQMLYYQADLDAWLKLRREHVKAAIRRELEEEERNRKLAEKEGVFRRFWRRFECLNRQRNPRAEPGAGRMVAKRKRDAAVLKMLPPMPQHPEAPTGVYIYGSVGCGKSLLMDLFFNCTSSSVLHRRRLHFNAAMLEVHSRMHALKHTRLTTRMQRLTAAGDDAVERRLAEEENEAEDTIGDFSAVARNFVKDSTTSSSSSLVQRARYGGLLCFDEMQVADVFTAVAIADIFRCMLRDGVVLVATSNRAPAELNKHGLQKEIFSKFQIELQQRCHVVHLQSATDYRRFALESDTLAHRNTLKTYFWPLDAQASALFENTFKAITEEEAVEPTVENLPVMFGRTMRVGMSVGSTARFEFRELCGAPVGAADYIALAERYHTLFISDIPAFSMQTADQARRFITLVDELYNWRCRLVCTAAEPPQSLFSATKEDPILDLESLQFETEAEQAKLRRDLMQSAGVIPLGFSTEGRRALDSQLSGREETFAFKRAISRLLEMQSSAYLIHSRACVNGPQSQP
eukprot:jgi/Chlat1/3476/Chrsp23S03670